MIDLRSLGEKYGTDKVEHGYLPHYEARFEPFRGEAITLLEIGVLKGESLRMWRDFFPRAEVYGIDIDPKLTFAEPRIKTCAGAQEDGAFLDSVLAETGPLDIVIDDGGHEASHQFVSFSYLWPCVKTNGWYCIEDCYCMFGPMWAEVKASFGSVGLGVCDPATILDFLYRRRGLIVTGRMDFAEIHVIAGGLYDGLLALKKQEPKA